MRTFRLLSIKPILTDSKVLFSKTGEGLYAYGNKFSRHTTTFRSLDPYNYSNMGK